MSAVAMKIQRKIEIEVPDLGQKIKQAREQDPRSLTEICELTGMTTSNWYRIEKEETKILPEKTLRSIEQVLGVDLKVNFDN